MRVSEGLLAIRATGIAALGFAAVLACAPAAAPPAAGPAAPGAPAAPAPPAAEPQRGGVLVWASRSVLPNLHPLKGDIALVRGINAIYEPLVRLDHRAGLNYTVDWEVKPGLAQRWEQPNPTTIVFSLVKNAKWHDGQPFTADDVVFTLQTWQDLKQAIRGNEMGKLFADVAKVDDSTVRLTLKAPSVELLSDMGYLSGQPFIIPKHAADNLERVSVGTGPFKAKSIDPKSFVIVERNPDYWQPGKPYLDGGKILQGIEPSTIQAAFIAKEMDFMNAADKVQHDTIKAAAPSLQAQPFAFGLSIHYYPRQDRPPFDDIRVRRAIHLALDRPAMHKALTFGEGAINPPGGVGARKGWGIPQEELQTMPGWRQPKDQDLAEAKRLLAEAGYPAGLKFTARYNGNDFNAPKQAEASAPMLRAVGLEVTLDPMDRAASVKAEQDGDYAVFLPIAADVKPNVRLNQYFHSKGPFARQAGINDAKLDALIERQDQTFDVAERKKLFYDFQKIIYENMYAIPMISFASYNLWYPWLKDYPSSYSPDPYPPAWENMWMDPKQAPQRTLG